jgi:hypothetical protein
MLRRTRGAECERQFGESAARRPLLTHAKTKSGFTSRQSFSHASHRFANPVCGRPVASEFVKNEAAIIIPRAQGS